MTLGRPVCRLEVAMEPRWKERIERYAQMHGVNQNSVVVEAIQYYFDDLERLAQKPGQVSAV